MMNNSELQRNIQIERNRAMKKGNEKSRATKYSHKRERRNKINNIEKAYSLEYTEFTKVYLTEHDG
jgi:hypothetical protein